MHSSLSFNLHLNGYRVGEDLEFSWILRAAGSLLIAYLYRIGNTGKTPYQFHKVLEIEESRREY